MKHNTLLLSLIWDVWNIFGEPLFIMMVFTQNKWGKKHMTFFTLSNQKRLVPISNVYTIMSTIRIPLLSKFGICLFYYFHIAFSSKSVPDLMNGHLLTRHQRVKLCGPNSESLYPKFLNPNFWSSIKIYFIKNEIRSSLSPLSNHVTFADKP